MVVEKIDKYAVFGNPVAHSKSPQIHTLFAQQTKQSLVYSQKKVEENQFKPAVDTFFQTGGLGLNITLPFKLEAYNYAARLTPRAQRAGAVNTLAMQEDGRVLGDNTDGLGMVRDIVDHLNWEITNKRVLILGAGGAVRGVLQPLMEQQPQHIVIANRTVAKALSLARGFKDLGKIQACGFEDLVDQKFDIVINGTAASLAGELPPLPENMISESTCCYDMMYAAQDTVFMRWARKNGCARVADGLGMLVAQAAESFFLWRGVRPKVDVVVDSLRQQLLG